MMMLEQTKKEGPAPVHPEEIRFPEGRRNSVKIEDFTLLEQIGNSKFPVYRARSNEDGSLYAVKIFPWENDSPSDHFNNEIRFANIKHDHIVTPIYFEKENSIQQDGSTVKVSLAVSEFISGKEVVKMLTEDEVTFEENLIRTYFHQLLSALEFLHSKGIFHLDIKVDNLMIDEALNLKLIDFDLAHFEGDPAITTTGTDNYRAPELATGSCVNGAAADLYSAAIVLFVLKSGVYVPYLEKELIQGHNMINLLYNDPAKFWEKQSKVQKRCRSFWSADFKELFEGMTKKDPTQRYSLSQIKESRWYQGKTFTQSEIYDSLSIYYNH